MTTAIRTHLSINVNKVALVRNTRHLGIPSVLRAVEHCLRAGAHGITVHPRPDERHIRSNDVFELAELLRGWPGREYNIEGNPTQNLMGFLRDLAARGIAPTQCTFVPDGEDQFTSDHGWPLHDAAVRARVAPLIAEARALGVRVSLFMDPDATAMAWARDIGADRVELYTEPYAAAHPDPAQRAVQIERYAAAAQAALDVGLGVNAGHDLNRDNLPHFLEHVPGVAEVSIGHAFVADALELGYTDAVRAYLQCMAPAERDNS